MRRNFPSGSRAIRHSVNISPPLDTLKWKDAVEDTEAIRRCLGGERDAFGNLVLRYQTEAVGHATAILGNPEDAREAVQEAFLDAFCALARFDLTRRFYPWFYALLRNRCFRLIR